MQISTSPTREVVLRGWMSVMWGCNDVLLSRWFQASFTVRERSVRSKDIDEVWRGVTNRAVLVGQWDFQCRKPLSRWHHFGTNGKPTEISLAAVSLWMGEHSSMLINVQVVKPGKCTENGAVHLSGRLPASSVLFLSSKAVVVDWMTAKHAKYLVSE